MTRNHASGSRGTPQERNPINSLSHRQAEVLAGIIQNLTNKEIAAKLNISERTVKYHVSALLNKFDVRGRIDLMLEANQMLPHEAVHKRTQSTPCLPVPACPGPAPFKAKGRPRSLMTFAGTAVH